MSSLYDSKEYSSLSDMVYHHVYEAITEGVYHDGDLLVEMKIAEELGVSRTPVREALKQLERENLVVALPNRGVMVRGMSSEDITDIYTIRALLEGQAAYWAAERSTPEQLDQMLEVLELMEIYTRRNDVARLVRLDSKFHGILYDGCRSSTIAAKTRASTFFIVFMLPPPKLLVLLYINGHGCQGCQCSGASGCAFVSAFTY